MSNGLIGARLLVVFGALVALQGCGVSDDDEGVGGVSASEAQALNEAAAMLDERAAKIQPAIEGDNALR